MHVSQATRITLAIGYMLAVPGLLVVWRALRDPVGRTFRLPNRAVIVAELIGAGCVTTGWFVAGSRWANAVNTLWVIACTTFWLRAENKLRLQREAGQ